MENEAKFLLRRAREESLKAIASVQPVAANVHEELAIRYSSKAITALENGDEPTCGPSAGSTVRKSHST